MEKARSTSRRTIHWPMFSGHIMQGDTNGFILDLSTRGMRFDSTALYQPGEIIEICIPLEPPLRVLLLARIVWTKLGRLQRHIYGVEILRFQDNGYEEFCKALIVDRMRSQPPTQDTGVIMPDHPLRKM